jgi:hypothetical protein
MKLSLAPIIASLAGVLIAGCESSPLNSAVPAPPAVNNALPGRLNSPQTADSTKLNSIRVGMTKQEMQSVMGTPDSTSAQANVEYLTYYLANTGSEDDRDKPYIIRVVDGMVESFGRFSELLDLYNRPVGAHDAATGADLATQLGELKALRDQGVLTDEEFQKAKTKLISQP